MCRSDLCLAVHKGFRSKRCWGIKFVIGCVVDPLRNSSELNILEYVGSSRATLLHCTRLRVCAETQVEVRQRQSLSQSISQTPHLLGR